MLGEITDLAKLGINKLDDAALLWNSEVLYLQSDKIAYFYELSTLRCIN
jgi:hypothetical protein